METIFQLGKQVNFINMNCNRMSITYFMITLNYVTCIYWFALQRVVLELLSMLNIFANHKKCSYDVNFTIKITNSIQDVSTVLVNIFPEIHRKVQTDHLFSFLITFSVYFVRFWYPRINTKSVLRKIKIHLFSKI